MSANPQDKKIICINCGEPFTWTLGEQEDYARRAFYPPKRCKICRGLKKEQRFKNEQHAGK